MNKRKRYRASEWSALLEQWARSGESAERFAARLGISVVTLARWQKKTPVSEPSSPMVEATPKSAEGSRAVFTPVEIVRPARTGAGGLVEVVTRGGFVVRVHGAVDEETLASVFAAVGGC